MDDSTASSDSFERSPRSLNDSLSSGISKYLQKITPRRFSNNAPSPIPTPTITPKSLEEYARSENSSIVGFNSGGLSQHSNSLHFTPRTPLCRDIYPSDNDNIARIECPMSVATEAITIKASPESVSSGCSSKGSPQNAEVVSPGHVAQLKDLFESKAEAVQSPAVTMRRKTKAYNVNLFDNNSPMSDLVMMRGEEDGSASAPVSPQEAIQMEDEDEEEESEVNDEEEGEEEEGEGETEGHEEEEISDLTCDVVMDMHRTERRNTALNAAGSRLFALSPTPTPTATATNQLSDNIYNTHNRIGPLTPQYLHPTHSSASRNASTTASKAVRFSHTLTASVEKSAENAKLSSGKKATATTGSSSKKSAKSLSSTEKKMTKKKESLSTSAVVRQDSERNHACTLMDEIVNSTDSVPTAEADTVTGSEQTPFTTVWVTRVLRLVVILLALCLLSLRASRVEWGQENNSNSGIRVSSGSMSGDERAVVEATLMREESTPAVTVVKPAVEVKETVDEPLLPLIDNWRTYTMDITFESQMVVESKEVEKEGSETIISGKVSPLKHITRRFLAQKESEGDEGNDAVSQVEQWLRTQSQRLQQSSAGEQVTRHLQQVCSQLSQWREKARSSQVALYFTALVAGDRAELQVEQRWQEVKDTVSHGVRQARAVWTQGQHALAQKADQIRGMSSEEWKETLSEFQQQLTKENAEQALQKGQQEAVKALKTVQQEWNEVAPLQADKWVTVQPLPSHLQGVGKLSIQDLSWRELGENLWLNRDKVIRALVADNARYKYALEE